MDNRIIESSIYANNNTRHGKMKKELYKELFIKYFSSECETITLSPIKIDKLAKTDEKRIILNVARTSNEGTNE